PPSTTAPLPLPDALPIFTGPLVTDASGALEKVQLSDSIVQALEPSKSHALSLSSGFVSAQRVTIFGDALLHKLEASEVLATGVVDRKSTRLNSSTRSSRM